MLLQHWPFASNLKGKGEPRLPYPFVQLQSTKEKRMFFTVCRVFKDWETCCICSKWLMSGQVAAFSEKGRLAHYRCAKKRHWKRKSRAKKKVEPIVREVAPVNRPIKVVRNGLIIN